MRKTHFNWMHSVVPLLDIPFPFTCFSTVNVNATKSSYSHKINKNTRFNNKHVMNWQYVKVLSVNAVYHMSDEPKTSTVLLQCEWIVHIFICIGLSNNKRTPWDGTFHDHNNLKHEWYIVPRLELVGTRPDSLPSFKRRRRGPSTPTLFNCSGGVTVRWG